MASTSYDRKSDSFVRVKLNSLTIDIDQDTKGNLWFSTLGNGFVQIQSEQQNMKKNIICIVEIKNTLVDNQENCTSIDNNGQMWVATMGGLCRYIPSKDCLESKTGTFPSQNINCIIETTTMYFGTTSNGLVVFAMQALLSVYQE